MNVNKIATQNAKEYARAQASYGEGAGTRRRLINLEIEGNTLKYPGYDAAFRSALAKQDMAAHAKAAVRERKTKDVSKVVQKNTRGLLTGNRQNLTPVIAVGLTAWGVAKQTGYDQQVISYTKRKANYVRNKAKLLKIEYKIAKAKRQLAKEF